MYVPTLVNGPPQRALTNWGVYGDGDGEHAPPGSNHNIWPCGARREHLRKHAANGNGQCCGGECSTPPGEVCALGGQLRTAEPVANSGNGLLGVGRWTLTTQAKAGATVIAQSVKHVTVTRKKSLPVTG